MVNKVFDLGFEPPNFEKRFVCISEDVILSAQISACFNKENTYFITLEPPRSFHKYWNNEFIKLNNLLAKINPEKIIFARVKPRMINAIKNQLKIRNDKYIYLYNKSQVRDFAIELGTIFRGELCCPPDFEKIAHALLEAKRKKLRLIVKGSAEYEVISETKSKHLVASDSSEFINPVILGNYAFAINADLKFFDYDPPYSPKEINEVIRDSRGGGKRGSIAKNISDELTKWLEDKVGFKYEFITFLTSEINYGYFVPTIATCHIYNRVLPSHFICGSIIEPHVKVESALLVDPDFFPNSETDEIKNLLKGEKVFIKELRGDKFSNLDLDNYIQFYPYDFLFICSHGDFPKGVQFKIKFKDKLGAEHIIVVNIFDTFDPTQKGIGDDRLIGVKSFIEFLELDGDVWYQKKYKKGTSKTAVEDFLAIERKDWNVLERRESDMKVCNVIVTKDPISPYMPMVHSISDPNSSPLVFNNACVSIYTLSGDFIHAGAKFYIGTLDYVNDHIAIKLAKTFFKKSISENQSLALSLWESQKELAVHDRDKLYSCIGCHFQKFSFNSGNKKKNIIERISKVNQIRARSILFKNLEKNVKERHRDALIFLVEELKSLNSRNGSTKS